MTDIYPQNATNTFDPSRKDYSTIQSLLNMGVSPETIQTQLNAGKKGWARGSYIDPQDVGNFMGSANFNFNAQQYLPGIQQTAKSIYDPQQAQLDILSNLSASKTEQARITTKEDFAKEMKNRIEAINARGAFFQGGALDQQADIGVRETRALNELTMQEAANQAGFLAQKAGLSAEQAQYIQEKLSGTENSLYSRWRDNISDMWKVSDYGIDQKRYSDERKDKNKPTADKPNLQTVKVGNTVYIFNPATGQLTPSGVSGSSQEESL